MIVDSVRQNSFPWVVFGMVSLPFVVLVWLLATSVSTSLERYQRLQNTIDVFSSGEALLYPLEDVAVYSPVYILINQSDINPLYNAAYDKVPEALIGYTNALRATNDPSSQDYASVIQTGWAGLDVTTSNSATLGPHDEVQRLTDRVYRSLGSLLFLLEFSAGKQVSASELLMLTVDDLHAIRENVSALHALSLFVSVRGGYLGSMDAQRFEASWVALEGGLQALSRRLAGLRARGIDAASAQRIYDLEQVLQRYLQFIDENYLLADVINDPWPVTNAQGVGARGAVHQLSAELLSLAGEAVRQAGNQKVLRDIMLAVGLVALYVIVSGIGWLFYRSREQMAHALAESRTKSQFLARMSHEIRTPLNGVIGLAELLHETNPDTRQKEYIGLIDSAGRALVNLVNDILDYAKIEAGKFQLDISGFNVRDLVNETCQIFSLQVNDNRCLMLSIVGDDVPLTVQGDSTRIRQVLINLIGNAVKFTRDGWIEVRVSCRRQTDEGVLLRFEVQDSGIGLSPDEQRHLFGMFSQASAGVATRFGGTGLGLSISRELVRLMGGDIDVSSARNWGSTFWFDLVLPLDEAVAPAAQTCTGTAAPVLLLDSSGQLARMTSACGAALASVKVVTSIEETLDAVSSGERFNMVVVYTDPTAEAAAAKAVSAVEAITTCNLPIKLVTGVRGDLILNESELTQRIVNDHNGAGQNENVAQVSVVTRSVFSLDQLVQLFQWEASAESDAVLEEPNDPVYHKYPELRVLVAEDNPVNQIVTCGYLRRLGIDADVAENGREAVQHYRDKRGQYDLILMDLDMPLLDGPSATRQIRALEHSNGWPRIRIVALSAHALPEYREQVVDAGMDAQLVKPVTLRQLSEALMVPQAAL